MDGFVDGVFRFQAILVYALPVPADHRRRPLRLQREPARDDLDRVHHGVVRGRAGQHRRRPRRSATASSIAFFNAILATLFGTMAALGLQRVGAQDAGDVRRPDLHQHHRPGDRHRPRDARLLRDVVRPHQPDPVRPSRAAARASSSSRFGHWTIISAHVLFNTSLVLLLVRARLSGHGPDARGGQPGPVRDAVADVPPDHLPAAPAGDRGGLPARVHVQLRRLRHHDVRDRPGLHDPAAVHLRPGQARRDARRRTRSRRWSSRSRSGCSSSASCCSSGTAADPAAAAGR